jgi:hypothetical protein
MDEYLFEFRVADITADEAATILDLVKSVVEALRGTMAGGFSVAESEAEDAPV